MMSFRTRKYYSEVFRRTAILLSFGVTSAVTAFGQQHLSVLRGAVLDAASRPAPGVRVRIVNEATGEARRVTSDAQGRFVLLQLEPGVYSVVADDDRYRPFTARVGIDANDDLSVTLPLAAPTISMEVDFRPLSVPVNVSTPAVRVRLPGGFMADLPLDGRRAADSALFAPATASSEFGIVGSGTGEGYTGHLLDGFYNTEPILGVAAVRPQVETINSLEVTRAPFDAASGRTAGAQVHLTSRSGTNTLAGGAFGFLQTAIDRAQFGGFAGGPLVEGRTFLFAGYEQTRVGEIVSFQSTGHDLSGRVDHSVGRGARLMARYALSDGTRLGRRGQHFGTSFTYTPAGALANDARFSIARVGFGPIADVNGIAESQSYQFTDTVSWTRGAHVVNAGGEWYAFSRGLSSGELAAHTSSAFVQDDWRPAPDLSISAGLRFGRLSRNDADVDSRTFVAPRLGIVWTAGPEGETAVRAGYSRAHQPDFAFTAMPVFDHWNVGAERQWGLTRTIEVAYVGSRGEDLPANRRSRYHALMLELEQRSETGLTAYVSYTVGKWTVEDFSIRRRSRFDARQKWTGAFTWSLPIGDERRWFSKGMVGEILQDMHAAGTFAVQSHRPVPFEQPEERSYKTLNLALLKNLRLDLQRMLQLRFETFNVANRRNPLRAFFVPEPFEPFGPESIGRRYQIGARFLF